VAWTVPLAGGGCLDGQCPLQVESVGESAGLACVVQPPAGHEGFWGGGAFSPDGSKLAAFVAAPAGGSPSAQVALVDVTDCSSQVLPSTPPVPVGEPLGSAHWSPDGTWLYFCGLSGPLHTYHLGHPGTGSLPLPSSYAFAAF
ncbi:MAG: hypothetical protein ACRDZQ_14135, partial [Acidimicrobiales bacterium]